MNTLLVFRWYVLVFLQIFLSHSIAWSFIYFKGATFQLKPIVPYPFQEHKMFYWFVELFIFLCLVSCLFLCRILLLGPNLLCRKVSSAISCPTYSFGEAIFILMSQVKFQYNKYLNSWPSCGNILFSSSTANAPFVIYFSI